MNVAGGGFGGQGGGYYLALGKMDVYSGGKEIATLCPVTVDSTYGIDDDVAQLTRPARLAEKPPLWIIPRTSPMRARGSLPSTRPACRAPA